MGRPPKSVHDRFWDKVIKHSNGCWLFISEHGKTKYGMLSVKPGEEYFAHRISWVIHHGPIPKGKKVLHKCDNPKCVNPKHLFIGSSQDNMDDMVRKGRSLKGEASPMSKLTSREVKAIRVSYHTKKYSQQQIANLFGINQTNVGFIVRRITWTHI